MAYSTQEIETIVRLMDGVPHGQKQYAYRNIAMILNWTLPDGRPNFLRVYRALQKVKKSGMPTTPPKRTETVGDAIKKVRQIINSIPRRLYSEPINDPK